MSPDSHPEREASLLSHYERIIEISRQLNSTYDHVALLQQIVAAAAELVNCEAASILLIDPTTGELRFEIATNMNPNEAQHIIIPMEGSIAGWIARHGEPRVIQDTTREPGHFQEIDQLIDFHTTNLLGVPMSTHVKVIGVLEVVNKRDRQRFNDIDINTLTTLASQAAVAIENARLFRQSDFIAEMVHELRTPLRALRASTGILLHNTVDDSQRDEMLLTMQAETDRLLRLTTDFLELAQMESGRVRLQTEALNLQQCVHDSVEVVAAQAQEKNLSILIDVEPITIKADAAKFKQMMLNLLTNAIKYNRPYGEIRITGVSTRSDSGSAAQISVSDTGPGMSRAHVSQIFQKFFRVEATAGDNTGTGLGLAITKHIVEAHGGEIWVESEPGSGTTFHVILPAVVTD